MNQIKCPSYVVYIYLNLDGDQRDRFGSSGITDRNYTNTGDCHQSYRITQE